MSLRDVAVLVVAVLAVVLTAAWSVRCQRTWGSQLVAGLVCGVAAAVAAAVPFVDVVPDAEEGVVAVGGALALVLVGAGVSLAFGGRTRRTRDQVPRS